VVELAGSATVPRPAVDPHQQPRTTQARWIGAFVARLAVDLVG
jgi:hypothetical protein